MREGGTEGGREGGREGRREGGGRKGGREGGREGGRMERGRWEEGRDRYHQILDHLYQCLDSTVNYSC